jgi:hypothetical protein
MSKLTTKDGVDIFYKDGARGRSLPRTTLPVVRRRPLAEAFRQTYGDRTLGPERGRGGPPALGACSCQPACRRFSLFRSRVTCNRRDPATPLRAHLEALGRGFMIKSRKWRSRGVETFALVTLGLGLGFAPAVRADPPKAKKQKPRQVAPTGKEDAAAPTSARSWQSRSSNG